MAKPHDKKDSRKRISEATEKIEELTDSMRSLMLSLKKTSKHCREATSFLGEVNDSIDKA